MSDNTVSLYKFCDITTLSYEEQINLLNGLNELRYQSRHKKRKTKKKRPLADILKYLTVEQSQVLILKRDAQLAKEEAES